jgi:hypothetical protein
METVAGKSWRWQHWLLATVSVATFAWFAICVTFKCRCEKSIWHEAQARAGLTLVGFVFLRMVGGVIFRERHFRWQTYLFMCLLSPLWIPLVFDLILLIHDSILA